MTEKEELEAILDVFTTDGWKLIQKDVELLYNQINRVDGCESPNDFLIRKGEVQRLSWFLNLEDWYKFMEGENAPI